MMDPKRHFGLVLFLCLAFSFLVSDAGHTLTGPAIAPDTTARRDFDHIPPALPLPLPARSQVIPFDRLACRRACEQIGFWDMEQELTQRLVNACKIGCDVGQDHCL